MKILEENKIVLERVGELEALSDLIALNLDVEYDIFQEDSKGSVYLGKFFRRKPVVENDTLVFKGEFIPVTPVETLTAKINIFKES